MIDLSKDTLEYGSLLKAPKGFDLDFAIGTTYSLDFSTLMSAYLSLGLSVGTDSSLADDPMHLFAALSEVRDKVAVFCEKGRIKGGRQYVGLYSQMESSIFEVDLPERKGAKYPSFHPKVWILRFRKKNVPGFIQYRICVLSRNITQDSSWDLACAFEGDARESHGQRSSGGVMLERFVGELMGWCKEGTPQYSGLKTVCEEIPYVYFKDIAPNGKWTLQLPFLETGVEGVDKKFGLYTDLGNCCDSWRRALVVSPFISEGSNPKGSLDPLTMLATSIDENREDALYVVTRASSLAGVDPSRCPWINKSRIFNVRDYLLTAECENEETNQANCSDEDDEGVAVEAVMESRDIHAKLYAIESSDGSRVDLYVGSANASYRGMHINHEFMAHFTSSAQGAFDSLLSDLGLDERSLEGGGLFDIVDQSRLEELFAAEIQEGDIYDRNLDHVLRKLNPEMTICKASDQGVFDVNVEMELDEEVEGESLKAISNRLKVSLASLHSDADYEKTVVFPSVNLESLTMFLRIEMNVGDVKVKRLVKCTIKEGEEFLEARRAALFNKIVAKDGESIMDYLKFKLSPNPEYASISETMKRGVGSFATSPLMEGLYEELLKAYSEDKDATDGVIAECLELMATGDSDPDSRIQDLVKMLEEFRGGVANV